MSSPAFRLPLPALRQTPAYDLVVALRRHAAHLQGHPVVARARAFRFTLPIITVLTVAASVVLVFVWAQLAYLAGKLILGNLLMLTLGFGAVLAAVVAGLVAVALATGVLKFRH
ncbi:hypothetical protein LG293_16680 (plasmid) [Citricoccus nitrophenolicus]